MSFVSAVPELVEAAAGDLAAIRSGVGQATASAAAATTSVLPAGADEISAAIAEVLGSHGEEFQSISSRAAQFHDEFVKLLNSGAGQYSGAEAAAGALLVDSVPGAPLQSIASFAAPYESLFAGATANIQGLGSSIAANPLPVLRQLLANQTGYLRTIGTNIVESIQDLPANVVNLPAAVENVLQDVASFQPGTLAQWIINDQIGYFNTVSTSLQSAASNFVTGLQALPVSFQAAGQALQVGDFSGAFNDVSSGLLNPFISGFAGALDTNGFVNVTALGAVGDLMPILAIPGQMAQHVTSLLPVGSIPESVAQNFTNVIVAATDTSQWINLGVSSLPIPLHVGLPLALVLDAIGPVLTTGDALRSSIGAFTGALQTGSVSGAASALFDAPAVIANGFLNGETVLPLNVPVDVFGGYLNSTTYLPLGGILAPLQTAELITDLTPGVPFPLSGAEFGGIVPGLLSYLPQQIAEAIGAA